MKIVNDIIEFIQNFPEFIEKNYNNPLLWICLFAILLIIARIAINSFADK